MDRRIVAWPKPAGSATSRQWQPPGIGHKGGDGRQSHRIAMQHKTQGTPGSRDAPRLLCTHGDSPRSRAARDVLGRNLKNFDEGFLQQPDRCREFLASCETLAVVESPAQSGSEHLRRDTTAPKCRPWQSWRTGARREREPGSEMAGHDSLAQKEQDWRTGRGITSTPKRLQNSRRHYQGERTEAGQDVAFGMTGCK